MQAKKTSSEDATIEIRTDFTLDEASNGGTLVACSGEEALEGLTHHLIEERLLRLVALVVGHADPLRGRVVIAGGRQRGL
jgi:hypothetical protein